MSILFKIVLELYKKDRKIEHIQVKRIIKDQVGHIQLWGYILKDYLILLIMVNIYNVTILKEIIITILIRYKYSI